MRLHDSSQTGPGTSRTPHHGWVHQVCLHCTGDFWVWPSKAKKGPKYCCTACRTAHLRGPNHHQWKGERTDTDGRVFISISGRGTVARARLVMEDHLGRQLRSDEQVHHINLDPSDDRLENLMVLSHEEHRHIHAIGRWSYVHQRCVSCGTTERPHVGHGYCRLCYDTVYWPMREGRWARDYDACVSCGGTDRPHGAWGLCVRCYNNLRYQTSHPTKHRRWAPINQDHAPRQTD